LMTRRGVVAAVGAVLLAGMLGAPPAAATDRREWTIGGHGGPAAHVRLDDGALTVSVTRGRDTVLEPSPVGIRAELADLTTGLRYAGRRDRFVREHYTTAVGKERRRDVATTETRLAFTTPAGARMTLVVRAAADGVAYRYELPRTTGRCSVRRPRSTCRTTRPRGSPATAAGTRHGRVLSGSEGHGGA
jgi:alpha-glucosidase